MAELRLSRFSQTGWGQTHSGMRDRGLRVKFPLLLFTLCVAASSFLVADDDLSFYTRRYCVDTDAGRWSCDPDTMSGEQLGQTIENGIGADNYQQVTVILLTCHSGAGVDNVADQLSGPSHVIASCEGGQKDVVTGTSEGEAHGFGPGFFDSVADNPHAPVDQHIMNARTSTPRIPKDQAEEDRMRDAYNRRRDDRIGLNEYREGEGQAPLRVPPEWDPEGRDETIQNPMSRKSDPRIGYASIHAGTDSNHAIIYETSPNRAQQGARAKAALEAAGFDSVHLLTPFSDVDNEECEAAAADVRYPEFRDDLAIPSKLEKVLEELREQMGPTEHLLVVVNAHGTQIEQSTRSSSDERRQLSPLPDEPLLGLTFDGEVFNSANPSDHIGTHESGSLIGEEATTATGGVIVDWYLFARREQPFLDVQTVEEANPSGQPVGVMVNGLLLGQMVLDPDGLGSHRLPFYDSFIAELLNTSDFTDGLTLEFQFADPGDSFRLATAGDVLVMEGRSGYYGISITYSIDGLAPPFPEVRVNGLNEACTIPEGSSASITIALAPGYSTGWNADWWVVASTPFGWYSFVYPATWQPGIDVCIQYPLIELSPPFEVLNMELPAGDYTFYFAVDDNADCDPDGAWLDSVVLTVE